MLLALLMNVLRILSRRSAFFVRPLSLMLLMKTRSSDRISERSAAALQNPTVLAPAARHYQWHVCCRPVEGLVQSGYDVSKLLLNSALTGCRCRSCRRSRLAPASCLLGLMPGCHVVSDLSRCFPDLGDQFSDSVWCCCTWSARREIWHCCCDAAELICRALLVDLQASAHFRECPCLLTGVSAK